MYIKRVVFICLIFALLACVAGCDSRQDDEPDNLLDIVFDYQWVGDIDKIKFNEPSGICWHSKRRTLFVIGDEGDICEIRTDGSLVRQRHICSADFEGITHDPGTGLLYIAVEGKEAIWEVDPDTFKVLRRFSIPRKFQGSTLMKKGAQGIEAITFIPRANHPEGGTFYVANQAFTLDDKEDISAIFEVELPLRSKTDSVKLLRFFPAGVIDLAGLYYDEKTSHVFAVSDAANILLEYSPEHKLINTFAFPGDNQEGITVDSDGYMYIAQDSGGIVKIKWLR